MIHDRHHGDGAWHALARFARTRGIPFGVFSALVVLPGCLVWTTSSAETFPVQLSSAAMDSARIEIMTMMQHSAQSWNRGDLDAFVADYAPALSTTFVGHQGILRGPDAIKQIYAPRFAPGGTRDSLSFENIEVDFLAPAAAHVIAYYRLMHGDSTTARGPTSLVMRKQDGQWRIVHDHSS